MPAYIATGCWVEERVGDGGWKHKTLPPNTHQVSTCLPRYYVTHGRASPRVSWLLMWSLPTWLPFVTLIYWFLCHRLRSIFVLRASSSPDIRWSPHSAAVLPVIDRRCSFLSVITHYCKSRILLRGKSFRHRNVKCGFNSICILYLCSKLSTNWVLFQALAQNSELRERLSKIHTESQIAEAAAVNVSAHVQVGDCTPPSLWWLWLWS